VYLPGPSIYRICMIYNLLDDLITEEKQLISSSEIGNMLGINAASIRKDISFLGEFDNTGARYDIKKLHNHISKKLKLNIERRACIVGIGRLGSAILHYDLFNKYGYQIVAGFDSNVNKIETLKTSIALYPAYKIPEIIKEAKIELAVLCVPGSAAQISADRLIQGGIKGIVNFTPGIIKNKEVFINNIDMVKEFQVLSAMISTTSPQ